MVTWAGLSIHGPHVTNNTPLQDTGWSSYSEHSGELSSSWGHSVFLPSCWITEHWVSNKKNKLLKSDPYPRSLAHFPRGDRPGHSVFCVHLLWYQSRPEWPDPRPYGKLHVAPDSVFHQMQYLLGKQQQKHLFKCLMSNVVSLIVQLFEWGFASWYQEACNCKQWVFPCEIGQHGHQ